MRRAQLGFRLDHGAWRAAWTTHWASVRGRTLSLRPQNQPATGGAVVEGKAIELETTGITRGQNRLAFDASPTLARDGTIELVTPQVTERFQNKEKGVEQSWRFERAPEGSGDLVVRVRVGGERWRARSSLGLHFVDPATGLGFRYGWASWVDAHGHRTTIRGSWHAGAIELRVPGSVVASSSFPAVLDPLVSPEFGINTPILMPPMGNERFPAVASDGTDWLIVWGDMMMGGIVGTRVAADGTQLTPPQQLTKALGPQLRPSIAFDGTNYVLAWQDARTQATTGWDVYAARVTPSGSVLDLNGFPVTTASGDQTIPDIDCATGSCLVAWQGSGGIEAARLSGASAGSTLSVSSSSAVTTKFPDVAFDGTNYLVVWQDSRNASTTGSDIYAAQVSEAGALVGSDTALSTEAGDEGGPALVFDGTRYFLIWYLADPNQPAVEGIRIATDLTILDSPSLVVSGSTTPTGKVAVDFDGTNYVAAWSDGTDLWAARVDTSGALVDTTSIKVGPGSMPEVAGNGNSSMITWQYATSSNQSAVRGARLMSDGTVSPSFGTPLYAKASQPRVAFDGTNWLVVWSESGQVRATRVDSAGTLLDPSGIDLGSGQFPDVASNGSGYLVAWQGSGGGLMEGQVSAQGTVLPSLALDPATDTHIRVASNGNRYLIAFQRGLPYPPLASWISVDANGGPSPPYQPTGSLLATYDPSVASDGVGFLLAWSTNSGVVIQKTTSTGAPQATSTLAGLSSPRGSALAFDGTEFLVAWSENGSSVHAAFAAADGASLGTPFLLAATGSQPAPELAFDGSRYLAVWADSSGGTDDVYGAYVTPGGVDPAGGFAIAQDRGLPDGPDVAADASGHSLVVYPEFDASLSTGRIYGRWVTSLPIGATCSSNAECATGECISSVCGCTVAPCPVSCQSAADCAADEYCWNNVCEPKLGTGKFCGDASQCTSGFCTDGVCCDSSCTGQCEACNEPGNSGSCIAVSGAPRGSRTQCSGNAVCGGSCNGVDPTACNFAGTSVLCQPSSCNSSTGMYTPASYCDGAGQCSPATPESCTAPYKCVYTSGAICNDVCSTSSDCIAGDDCVNGRCKATNRADGMPCGADTDCANSHCVDGVCCDTACTGQCEACDVPGSEGTCSAVTGKPHGSRSVCQAQGACTATCDGSNRQVCTFPHVQCAAGSCSGGVESTSYCDSTGACVAEQNDCGDYACGPYLCLTACSTNADCAAGRVCVGGACVASDAGTGGQGGSAGAGGAGGGAGDAGIAGGGGNGGSAGAAGTGNTADAGGGSAGQPGGDAGVEGGTPLGVHDNGGCGCQAPRRAPDAPWAVFAVLVWAVRRRRGVKGEQQ